MGKNTGISWVANPDTLARGRTWNPVTGCDKISDGCTNCYALTTAARLQKMGARRYANDGDPVTSGPGFAVTLHEDLIDAPRHWRQPTTVFVNSMSDLLHARVPAEFVERIFDTMHATPEHIYQVLTKRAVRLPRLVDRFDWPANMWMGVTVENAEAMDRIGQLATVPTSVRFISAEPLLGALPDLGDHLDGIDWVIVGGESGAGARPLDLAWVRDIKAACTETDTAFFFKQTGNLLARELGLGGKGDKPAAWEAAGGEIAELFTQAFPTASPDRVRPRR